MEECPFFELFFEEYVHKIKVFILTVLTILVKRITYKMENYTIRGIFVR